MADKKRQIKSVRYDRDMRRICVFCDSILYLISKDTYKCSYCGSEEPK